MVSLSLSWLQFGMNINTENVGRCCLAVHVFVHSLEKLKDPKKNVQGTSLMVGPVIKTLLPMQCLQVPSLVSELGSHMPSESSQKRNKECEKILITVL